MRSLKQRKFNKWEMSLFFAPVLVLVLAGLASRLKTIELPRNRLIESGQPLFTVVFEFKPSGSLTASHAVRMPNGAYKVYWVEESQLIPADRLSAY